MEGWACGNWLGYLGDSRLDGSLEASALLQTIDGQLGASVGYLEHQFLVFYGYVQIDLLIPSRRSVEQRPILTLSLYFPLPVPRSSFLFLDTTQFDRPTLLVEFRIPVLEPAITPPKQHWSKTTLVLLCSNSLRNTIHIKNHSLYNPRKFSGWKHSCRASSDTNAAYDGACCDGSVHGCASV